MFAQLGQLYEKLESGVHFPAPRGASRLLPLAPESTVFYAAMPNYGDVAAEALTVFHRELQQNPPLRKWWRGGDMAATSTGLEDALQKFHDVAQYLGDEIVVAGAMEKPDPSFVVVAQISKPGLKAVLQQMIAEASAKSKGKPGVRILDPRELAAASNIPKSDFLVLVRPDYVVGSPDLATLRSFNSRLDGTSGQFASTAFGQRVVRAYQDGVTLLAAADLHAILNKATIDTKKEDLATAQRTGFTDVEYLVWEHTRAGTRDISQTEVSFVGPRQGIASWLGPPKILGGLDFASPKAIMAISLNLADPGKMFDDLRALETASNPNGFAEVSKMEKELNISLKRDLLQALTGEIAIEVDSVAPPAPTFKLMLGVRDPARLEQTLAAMLEAQHLSVRPVEDSGTTFHVFRFPQGQTPIDLTYTIADGYLIFASTPEAAQEAIRLHHAGESLAKSQKFLASLPPGHENGMSAVFYQDPMAVAALQMQAMSGGKSGAPVSQVAEGTDNAALMTVYASDKAIRSESTNQAMDAGVVLITAAIAIPNLLRSRVAANEASAVGSLRTLNTAQVVYASTYPDRGFAANLASLGGGGGDATHAGLIDATLGCSSGQWCEKSGYRFRVTATCLQGQCPQYVTMATPVSPSTGQRNFCSTSDGVIRFNMGPPLTEPLRAVECKSWRPLQ